MESAARTRRLEEDLAHQRYLASLKYTYYPYYPYYSRYYPYWPYDRYPYYYSPYYPYTTYAEHRAWLIRTGRI